MKKIVRYNGGTDSYYPCSSPTVLKLGGKYELSSVERQAWHTNYTLKGVDGVYNSCWFDDVGSPKGADGVEPYFMGISRDEPTVGKPIRLYRFDSADHRKMFPVTTSPVVAVERIGGHIYKIATMNSVYVVTLF